jgi:two-component system NtrC family sensor kinase
MDINTLYQLHKALESYLELSPLFETILGLMPELGADYGSLLVEEGDEIIHFRSTIPGQKDLTEKANCQMAHCLLSNGLVDEALGQGKPKIVEDFSLDPLTYQNDDVIAPCRGAVLIPMQMTKAHAQGILLLGSKTAGAFSDADLPLLEIAARQIGQAIESTLLYLAQAENLAQLALINEVSRAATSILNVEVMLGTVTQAIQRSFGFQQVSIYRFDQGKGVLRLDVFTGVDGRTLRPERMVSLTDKVITWAAENRQTVSINEADLPEHYESEREGTTVVSKLVIPIKLGVKTIAILDLESNERNAFSSRLVSALETLADQLAIAIENARLYDEVCDKVNELLSLNRISQVVSSSLDFQQTLTLIIEHVTALLNVAATSVALRDDETDEIWFAAAFGAGAEDVLGMRMPLGQGVIGWVAKTGEAVIIPDVQADPHFFPDMDKKSGFTTKSILCVPLETKGRLIGAIETMNKLDGSSFTIQDLNQLADLTAPAATAIENAQLYHELAQKINQLEETQAQLVQSAKLSAIGELAAGVAHEINNPLTSIIGLSKIMLDEFKETQREIEDLKVIQDEAQRAKKIVRALLDFARVGAPVWAAADINEILTEAILLTMPEKVQYKIKLSKNLGRIPLIPMDENQMKQVFINILNNAIYTMPQGGQITITSQLLPPDHQFVQVSIADTGGGISPQHLDKIFDPFFTTKAVGEGTGLGLSVSYGIIERHHGKIEVENEPGVGATFHVILPIANKMNQ